tara:strand:+ start:324 stop:530 length:207 start_codon:yes stop_codon:yes gene_type:complete
MGIIILESGVRIRIPDYDNLEKIGNKTKLIERLEELEAQGYDIEEMQSDPSDPLVISRVGRTYYLDRN